MKKTLFFIFVILVLVSSASCTRSATKTQVADIDMETTEEATEEVASEVSAVEAIEEPQVLIVDYIPPENAIPLTAFGNIKGYFYAVNIEEPYQVEYPYQSTLLITVGNAWIGEDADHITLTSDGTIGNIYADICAEKEGCSIRISDYTAGHVGITVVFGGMEVPSQTLTDAVNNMFTGSNCGGSGCKTIYVYNASGKSLEFTKEIEASDVNKVLIVPEKPYAQVTVGNSGAPAGAEVLVDETNDPIGQMYYLAEKEAFVSVPEAGGTIIYCGSKATINGKSCSAGFAVVFYGTASDGGTPEDLNQTIKIISNDPNMIRVIMIYSGSFKDQVFQLKAEKPDWDWPE